MPGTVLTVEARAGQPVRRGDPLLTLEAMKMQNIIRAPADAVVAELLVAPGQAVGYGDPLVRFEAGAL
jgi:biotin carboxyl carrier protein